jgi:hypothetical protein
VLGRLGKNVRHGNLREKMLCIRDAKIMGHKRRAVGVLILHFLPTNVLLFVLGPVQLYRNKPGFVQIIKIYIK